MTSPPEDAADKAAFRALVEAVRERIDVRLARWLETRVATAEALGPDVGAVARAIADLSLRGGKRLRPALIAAGFNAYDAAPWAVCEPAMLSIELLQSYLLVHDDWMDDDEVRRGGPSVHVLLRERFRSQKLGDAAAILAGDLAASYAEEVLHELELPPERVVRAARVFAKMQVDIVTGQVAEMRSTVRATGSESDVPSVETIYALKTASYTVTGPLMLGATLAGADDRGVSDMERFGRPLGIAFQLRDDLLGIFGEPTALGKPIWNDIREGKRTGLVVEVRKDPRAAPLLARALGNADATTDELRAVAELMDESGARARVEARVRALCDTSRDILASIAPSISTAARSQLAGAVSALGERTS